MGNTVCCKSTENEVGVTLNTEDYLRPNGSLQKISNRDGQGDPASTNSEYSVVNYDSIKTVKVHNYIGDTAEVQGKLVQHGKG
jgi:hypothetical protein